MKYEIIIDNEQITFIIKQHNEIHDKIYDWLTRRGIKHELASDCASWCELATVGETYNEERFEVSVEDGDEY